LSLPLGFVVAASLRRRHLNETQRAMVAAELAKGRHASIDAPSKNDAADLLHVNRPCRSQRRRLMSTVVAPRSATSPSRM
jgi:hypothetical protein